MVLSDTLQIRPAIARYGTTPHNNSSLPSAAAGTMVIHDAQTDGAQEQGNHLAWAAKAAGQNLLNAGNSSRQAMPQAKRQPGSQLQSLFEPPTPVSIESSPQRAFVYLLASRRRSKSFTFRGFVLTALVATEWLTPGAEYQQNTPAYARETQATTAIKMPQAHQTDSPSRSRTPITETPEPSTGQFTFSYPQERRSWKSLRHFNSPDIPSPQGTPRHSTPPVDSTPKQQQQRPQSSALKFRYDTHTRNQLEALADEFEGLTFANAAQQATPAAQQPLWREGSPEALPHTEDEDRPIGRSAKRLRLSPEAVFSQPFVATPGSALRDRIRSRRATTGYSSTADLYSKTPVPMRTQAQSLPAGFKTAPQPQRFTRQETHSEPSFAPLSASGVPAQQKLQAAQALMDRIIQSQGSDPGQSANSSSDSSLTEGDLEQQPNDQQQQQQPGTLPPLYEVTEEELDPASFDQSLAGQQHPQPLGSPALSDGTVPLPPSPDFSHFTGASPTFAHRQNVSRPAQHHNQIQSQEQDAENSYADIPPPAALPSPSTVKRSQAAEQNLRRSLTSQPSIVQASPLVPQRQGAGPQSYRNSFAHTTNTHADTRISSYGSAFSATTGLTSTTSLGVHQPRVVPQPQQQPPDGAPADAVRPQIQNRYPQMTTIAPSDDTARQALAASEANGMVFDHHLHRWVKAASRRQASADASSEQKQIGQPGQEGVNQASEEEDPFKDIESLGDGSQPPTPNQPSLWLPNLEDEDVSRQVSYEEPEESTDGRVPLHKLREQTPYVAPDGALSPQSHQTSPSLAERPQHLKPGPSSSNSLSPPMLPTHASSTPTQPHRSLSPVSPAGLNELQEQKKPPSNFPATPLPAPRAQSAPTVPRSALKNRHSVVDSTPLPKGMSFSGSASQASENQTGPRSVSFSDGRTQGKMRDATPIVVPAFKRSGSQPPARSSGLKNEISVTSASSGDETSKDLTGQSQEEAEASDASKEDNEEEDQSDSLHLPLDEISDTSEDDHGTSLIVSCRRVVHSS